MAASRHRVVDTRVSQPRVRGRLSAL